MKDILQHTLELIDSKPPIPLKVLESYRGSLVYLQRTYPAVTPNVKGFHLTIDSWRPDRDEEGWQLPKSRPRSSPYPPAPAHINPVPRFRDDVVGLQLLFTPLEPPVHFVCSNQIHTAMYGYADASGGGFGSTIGNAKSLTYTHGIWAGDSEGSSSNYRELSNLIDTLERGVQTGQLHHTEVWLITDNSMSEEIFWKGHSSSPLLNSLALRLWRLEMSGLMRIHMVHIPGTRMIEQGTDRLSRGDLTEGVMKGQSILEFVPLNLSATDRQPVVEDWLRSWLASKPVQLLQPSEWFTAGHGIGSWALDIFGTKTPVEAQTVWLIWAPPPALADVALEELEESRHKRKHINHVWVMP